MRNPFFFITALFFLSTSAFTQTLTPKEIEADLVNVQGKLMKHFFISDSVLHYAKLFSGKMLFYTNTYPATLDHPFQSAFGHPGYSLVTSADGLFRIYSWDNQQGGTMRFYHNIFQFRADGKVYCKVYALEEGDPSSSYSEIYTVSPDKTIYLAVGNGIYSSTEGSVSIKAFTIKEHLLIDTVRIFKTSDTLSNELFVQYDFSSIADHPERPAKLISFDADRQMLYMPIADDKRKITGVFEVYQLKEPYFERIGTAKKQGGKVKKE